jgi:adenosine deaminase
MPELSLITALEAGNLKALRGIAKSDLHNHGMMGGRLRSMEKFYGAPLAKFSSGKEGISGINNWIVEVYRDVLQKPGAFEAGIRAAFEQAVSDGVTVLEMSIDIYLGTFLNIRPREVAAIVHRIHQETAPDIDFRPELGFNRSHSIRTLLTVFEPYLELNYFHAIDLYDNESAQPVENFRELFRFACANGMKCKAHAGEFGDAESVRESVEVLQLDAVQHGIGAAQSTEVMKWLAERGVQLNVCPASNISLKRARSYKTHPIRILFDHGVKVTINTDDVMLFNKGNSEQYMHLFRCGLFSATELDQIRLNGLN